MKINDLAKEVHEWAVGKGFWPEKKEERNTAECIMLIVTELSEAVEADRVGKYCQYFSNVKKEVLNTDDEKLFKKSFEAYIKDTFEDELSDAIIRIVDLAESKGIDLETHIALKMRYNGTRPHKHGKKY